MLSKSFKLILLFLITLMTLISSCTEENVQPEQNLDFFPINPNNIYTFRSNAITGNEDSSKSFEMMIDEYSFPNGKFLALLERFSSNNNWSPIIGIKDSNNKIYSLGDNPPEGLFPLFKHKYEENEVTNDEVIVNGKKYSAKRLDMSRDNALISWWFVSGIGLVKEESPDGVSLFSDDHYKENYFISTELINFTQ